MDKGSRASALGEILDLFGEFFDLLGLFHHGDGLPGRRVCFVDLVLELGDSVEEF
jgi:hypothetical protein